MHETMVCVLVGALAFVCGVVATLLVKTIHLEKKEHEHGNTL